MWRSRRLMPVSSVCRFTYSTPATAPASPPGATSPLTLRVRASKLPPTLNWQTTVTLAADTVNVSPALTGPAVASRKTAASAAFDRYARTFISTLVPNLLNRLERQLHRERARSRAGIGEDVAAV